MIMATSVTPATRMSRREDAAGQLEPRHERRHIAGHTVEALDELLVLPEGQLQGVARSDAVGQVVEPLGIRAEQPDNLVGIGLERLGWFELVEAIHQITEAIGGAVQVPGHGRPLGGRGLRLAELVACILQHLAMRAGLPAVLA